MYYKSPFLTKGFFFVPSSSHQTAGMSNLKNDLLKRKKTVL